MFVYVRLTCSLLHSRPRNEGRLDFNHEDNADDLGKCVCDLSEDSVVRCVV